MLFHVAADIYNPIHIALGDAAQRSNELHRLAVDGCILTGLLTLSGHHDIVGLTPDLDGTILGIHFTGNMDVRQNRECLLITIDQIMHLIGGKCRRFLRIAMDGNCSCFTCCHAERANGSARIFIGFGDILRLFHSDRIVIHFAARLSDDDIIHVRRQGCIILYDNRRRTFGCDRAAAGNITCLGIDITAGRYHIRQIDVIHIQVTGNRIRIVLFIIGCQTEIYEHSHQRRKFRFIARARTAAFRIFADELRQFVETGFDTTDIIVGTDGEVGRGNTGFIGFFSVLIVNLHEIAHLPISCIRLFGRRQAFVVRIAHKNYIIGRNALAFLLIVRTHVLVLVFRQYHESLVRIAADGDFLVIGNTGRDASRHSDVIVRPVISTGRISIRIHIGLSVRLGHILRIALAAISRIGAHESADGFFPRIGVQIHILHRFHITGNIDAIILGEMVGQSRICIDRNDRTVEYFCIGLQIQRCQFIGLELTGVEIYIATPINMAGHLHIVVSRDVVGCISIYAAGKTRAVFSFGTIGDVFIIRRTQSDIAIFSKGLQCRTRFGGDQIVGADIERIVHGSTATNDTECVHECIGLDIVVCIGPILLLAFGRHIAQVRRSRAIHRIGERSRPYSECTVAIPFDDVILSIDGAECIIVFRTDADFAACRDGGIRDCGFRILLRLILCDGPADTGHGHLHGIGQKLRNGMVIRRRSEVAGHMIVPAHDDFGIGLHGVDRFGCHRADTYDTAAVTIGLSDARHAASCCQCHRFRIHGLRRKFHRHMAIALGIRFIGAGCCDAADRFSVDIRRIIRIVIGANRQSAAFSRSGVTCHDLRLAILIERLCLRVDPLVGSKGNISCMNADLSIQIGIGPIDNDIHQAHIESGSIGIGFHFAQSSHICLIGDHFRPVANTDFTGAIGFCARDRAAALDKASANGADFGRHFRRIGGEHIDRAAFEGIVFADRNLIDPGLVIAASEDCRRFRRIPAESCYRIHISFCRALRSIGRCDIDFLVVRLFYFHISCGGDKFAIFKLCFRRLGGDLRILYSGKLAAIVDGNRIIDLVFHCGHKHTGADQAGGGALDFVAHFQRFPGGNIEGCSVIFICHRISLAMGFCFQRGAGNVHSIFPASDEARYGDIDGTAGCRRLIDLLGDFPEILGRNRELLPCDLAICDSDFVIRLYIGDAHSHIDASGTYSALRQIHGAIRRLCAGDICILLRLQRRTGDRRGDAGRSRIRLRAIPAGIIFL